MEVTLSPSEIRFSQDSISHKFLDGNLLTSTFALLISGKRKVVDLPSIACALKDGKWYAVSGNRRLFLYKKLQKAGAIKNITVWKLDDTDGKNFTTKCDGDSIYCRGPGTESQIEEIIAQWKRKEDVVSKWEAPPEPNPPKNNYGACGYYDSDEDEDSD